MRHFLKIRPEIDLRSSAARSQNGSWLLKYSRDRRRWETLNRRLPIARDSALAQNEGGSRSLWDDLAGSSLFASPR